ncbi:MAG TPA: hypothetical protein VKP30_22535 [Polyangiaceae bacterium]|nr:hypothetical protein [Polyangiaceae bacterium]
MKIGIQHTTTADNSPHEVVSQVDGHFVRIPLGLLDEERPDHRVPVPLGLLQLGDAARQRFLLPAQPWLTFATFADNVKRRLESAAVEGCRLLLILAIEVA